VECATCGLLAERISHVAGAAACYRNGIVLPVLTDPLPEAADKVQHQSGADFVLVIGAEVIAADPSGHMLSTIPLGLFPKQGQPLTIQLKWSGNPAITKSRAAKSALDLLRRHLANR
jgi:nicotinamide mononucleotide (NMN) deamidase PncC